MNLQFDVSIRNSEGSAFLFTGNNRSKRVYDVNCDVTSASFQMSVGNVFKMVAP